MFAVNNPRPYIASKKNARKLNMASKNASKTIKSLNLEKCRFNEVITVVEVGSNKTNKRR